MNVVPVYTHTTLQANIHLGNTLSPVIPNTQTGTHEVILVYLPDSMHISITQFQNRILHTHTPITPLCKTDTHN